MKKLLTLLAVVLALAAFFYYYFSAPKVLERRLDSLLGTMSFGLVSLGDLDKEGDRFAAHFAEEVTFSGAGNEIISGSATPTDLRSLYLEQYRLAAKSAKAERTGEFSVKLTAAHQAVMNTTIQIDLILRDNTSYPQTMPAKLNWKKESGEWVISEVQLQLPSEVDLDF